MTAAPRMGYVDWLYQRTCERKTDYRTPTAAVRGLSKAHRLNPSSHFSVYQCPFCGLWHIGKSNKKDPPKTDT